MAKNLIIGGFSGYNYNQLKPWVESIDEAGIDADKCMIVGNTDVDTLKKLKEKNFDIVKFEPQRDIPPHIPRWIHVYTFLKEHGHNYENVVMTDLKDVYFQGDPFKWMEENLGDKILSSLKLKNKKQPDWKDWKNAVDKIVNPKNVNNIVIRLIFFILFI